MIRRRSHWIGRRRSHWIDSGQLLMQLSNIQKELTIRFRFQDWQDNSLDPELFGFKMVDDLLEPISLNKEPEPPFLMKVKKCELGSVDALLTGYREPINATVRTRVRTLRSVIMRLMYGTILMDSRVTSPMRRIMSFNYKTIIEYVILSLI